MQSRLCEIDRCYAPGHAGPLPSVTTNARIVPPQVIDDIRSCDRARSGIGHPGVRLDLFESSKCRKCSMARAML